MHLFATFQWPNVVPALAPPCLW